MRTSFRHNEWRRLQIKTVVFYLPVLFFVIIDWKFVNFIMLNNHDTIQKLLR